MATAARARVAVVGGGLSGLVAAHVLAEAGLPAEVIEASETPGGRLRTEEVEGCLVEVGAQFIPHFAQHTLRLVRQLGLGDDLVAVPPRGGVVRGGRLYDTSSPTALITGGLLSFGSRLRTGKLLAAALAEASRLDPTAPERAAPLDDESVASYVRRELNDEILEHLIQPSLGSLFFWEPERTSRGYFLVGLSQGLAVGLYALRGGFRSLVDALASRVSMRLATTVHSLVRRGDGVMLRVEREGRTAELTYEGAVCALPAPLVPTLVSDLEAEERDLFDACSYTAVGVVALVLDGTLAGVPYGYHLSRREFSTLWAVVCASRRPGHVPPGREVLIALVRERDADGAPLSDGQLLERTIAEVARLPGMPADLYNRLRGTRVWRWPLATPEFPVGHLQRLARFRRRSERASRVTFAGDYLVGPFLEGAVVAGRRAAQALLGVVSP
ncbi:MAG TPA: FAD-dependent oxidoreductase [Chloroflexota bacterium]